MTDDARVAELLEELLDSGGTPEVVCRGCPELLPQVKSGLARLRLLDDQLSALFPPSDPTDDHAPAILPSNGLPEVRGYEVQRVLGRGGMGIVYKAWHLRLNRPVALKMLLAGPYAQPEELERFLREAEVVAGLSHPNIVQVYDVGDVGGRPYFTMELVEGGSLAKKLAGAPLPARPAADVYALGAILYECLTGRPPFKGETPAETVHQVLTQDPVPPSRLDRKVPRDRKARSSGWCGGSAGGRSSRWPCCPSSPWPAAGCG